MRFAILLLAAAALPAGAFPVLECPSSVPVVWLAPHETAGFQWASPIQPNGDPCVKHIVIEPFNSSSWYVGGQYGLYVTKNAGGTWIKPLTGNVGALLIARNGDTSVIYAGVGSSLYRSTNSGFTWTNVKTFPYTVTSLLVFQNKLYAGLAFSTHATPSGVWSGNLDGSSMIFKPFGPGHTGLIVWTLSAHAATGAIYAGTEIYDHPVPYDPPFFRTLNGGNSWTNVGAGLPHHAVDSDVRQSDGYVYALVEAQGVYGSANQGVTWTAPDQTIGVGIELLMDPQNPTRLYAGRGKTQFLDGGIFMSVNAGQSFRLIGLEGVTVSGIALNRTRTQLFVAAYASGIYVGKVP